MKIKKINYLNIYSIGQYESWLSDMAKKGFLLEKISPFRSTFIKCDSCDMEYRTEPSDKPMTTERIDIYENNGWKYVCSYNNFHVFSALRNENLKDFHTDLMEQNIIFKNLIYKLTYLIFIMFIGTLLIIWFGDGILRVGNTPHINFFDGGWKILGSIFGMLYILILSIILCFKCIHIRKKLINNNAINHHSNWKKSYLFHFCVTNIMLLFSIVYFILVIVDLSYGVKHISESLNGDSYLSLDSEHKIPVSITRLADIAEMENLVSKQDNDSEKTNLNNTVKKEQGIFITNYYETNEHLSIKSSSENHSNDISLRTKYYKLLMPFMADGVLDDLVKACEKQYDGYKKSVTIAYKKLDKVYLLQEAEGFYSLFIKKGNIVEHVTYCGSQSYNVVLEVIAKSLNYYE